MPWPAPLLGGAFLAFASLPRACDECDWSKEVWGGPARGCVPIAPCEWGTHDYRLRGGTMECVLREPNASALLWYNMDHGRCTVVNGTESRIAFKLDALSGVSFTNAPYTKVLMPAEVDELSDMHHYAGKAVAVAMHVGDGRTAMYVGGLAAGTDGVGVVAAYGRRTGRRRPAAQSSLMRALQAVYTIIHYRYS